MPTTILTTGSDDALAPVHSVAAIVLAALLCTGLIATMSALWGETADAQLPGVEPVQAHLIVYAIGVSLVVIAVGLGAVALQYRVKFARYIRALNENERNGQLDLARQLSFLDAFADDLRTLIMRMELHSESVAPSFARDAIELELDRMNILVESAFAWTRRLRGINEAQRPVDADGLFDGLIADYQEAGCLVKLEGLIGMPVVTCPSALCRILANLIDNGLRAGGDVRLRVYVDANRLVVAVKVTRNAIAPLRTQGTFYPKRGEAGGHRTEPSLDLSLAIARRQAQSMNGDLELERSHDGVLEARLSLPLIAA